jgi:hypothetical protein
LKPNCLFVIAALLAAVSVTPALAQSTGPRPPAGGLFGATRSDVGSRNKLNFTFTVAEGFDSELPPDFSSRLGRGLESGGFSTIFQGASEYARRGRRLQLQASASTAFKYFANVDRLEALSHDAALSGSIRIPHGSVRIEQGAAYSPSFLYQLFPVDTPDIEGSIPTNPDYQIAETESYSYQTLAALELGSAHRTQFTATGRFNRTDFPQQAANELETAQAGVIASRRLSPSITFEGGYDWGKGDYESGVRARTHQLPIGIEYSPALSRTRRAAFRLALTPTWLEGSPAILDDADATFHPRVFYVGGEASVSVPFRPNWAATARYRRSIQHLAIANEPLFSDAAYAELTGLLSRRVDFVVSGGFGQAAATTGPALAQRLDTYTGHASVRYAVRRSLALSIEYLYYYYNDKGQQVDISQGLPGLFEQHGVRVGVVLFLEALGR